MRAEIGGDASLSQGAAKVASNPPAAGREARNRRSEGAHPADTLGLDSGLQNREMLISIVAGHSVCRKGRASNALMPSDEGPIPMALSW